MRSGDYSVLLFTTHLDVSSSNKTCSCDLTVGFWHCSDGGTPQRMTHQTVSRMVGNNVLRIFTLAFVDEAERVSYRLEATLIFSPILGTV